jgi:hypothetical protein
VVTKRRIELACVDQAAVFKRFNGRAEPNR